ncbi:MAG TPA: hypothetical protein VKE22_16190 [Haliangiales bacterium]|nr:hypothetical protein [Haliangiales bacterium]
MTLLDRVGQALVAPRRAMARVDADGGGAADALVLVIAKLVAVELPALVVAGWALILGGVGQAVTFLLVRVRGALGMDVILMLVGGAVVTLVAGRRRSPGRDFDLACVAWTPVLVVDVTASLAANVLDARVPPWLRWCLWGVALVWMGALLGMAAIQARSREAA